MVFFAYAALSCGMFGTFTAYSFLWTDYNSFILVLSSLSQAYFPVFSMKFSGHCHSAQKCFFLFVLSVTFSFRFFQQNSNFTVNFSYSAAFSRPRPPCIRGVQEMFSAVRTPLSARSRFRESSGSHAKCFCMNIHSSIHQYFAVFFLLSAISHQINRFYSTLLR